MAVALIVAAGRGERLGLDRPKALVTLAGRTMLEWSLDALRRVPAVRQIVVALPPRTVPAPQWATEVVCVTGAEVRSGSVREALRAAGDGDPVIVHDAARPLATAELFERALAALEDSQADGVVAAAPVADTIKQVGEDGQTVARTIERSRLWAIQTPQVFRRAVLERALEEASEELLAAATDDAWLIERAGGVVRVVQSDPRNIKITTATDLQLAEALLSGRT